VATYAELSGAHELAGRDLAQWVGRIGLIEARHCGRTFAQLYAALALQAFGTDLNRNSVWQGLSPAEREEWRSLLDPGRFYDRKTRTLIHLPENYFGVAARIAAISYRLGFITDRAYVDEILDRAVKQFTSGALFADDAFPAGRFDRYSNEYARYCYFAAETAGRTDLLKALAPTLKEQMRVWWDVLSPDGYGYPWGRSLGAIGYMDTMEIVGFLGVHPEFRPAAMPELAAAYHAAWQWLQHDYQPGRHLLDVFAFGRGNYSYINPQREWQQTTAFFGKVAGAEINFERALKAEGISEFPAAPSLPAVHRFEFFRRGDRPAGVWLVRQGLLRFALPITTGTQPGISDYLPAPFGLPGFAAPVEQFVPVVTPYIQLADGRVIAGTDGADEIDPSADGLSVRAVWKRWAQLGRKSGEDVDPGFTAEVTWKLQDDGITAAYSLSAPKPVHLRRLWFIVPSTSAACSTSFTGPLRTDRFDSADASLEVELVRSDLRFETSLRATGDTALGRSPRGYIPLYLEFNAPDVTVPAGTPAGWTLRMTERGARVVLQTIPTIPANPDFVH